MSRECDVCVIGAGFGGLSAALELASSGMQVILLETLKYPGGCAGSFQKDGYTFDAGATLSGGLGQGQLFRKWIDKYNLSVHTSRMDPVIDFRGPGFRLQIPQDREIFIQRIAEQHANAEGVRAFFKEQRETADKLWTILNNPSLLPPLSAPSLLCHIKSLPQYLPLLKLIGRPLNHVLGKYGLDQPSLFRSFLDATCQITVQCGVNEAESTFALSSLDYYFRGASHIQGGPGQLAKGLVHAIEEEQGQVKYCHRAKALKKDAEGYWIIESTKGAIRAPFVVANLLPATLQNLLPEEIQCGDKLSRLDDSVQSGWGACMLYRVVRRPVEAKSGALHIQIIQDPAKPLQNGNHLFCSISAADETQRAPAGYSTMTVSTHIRNKDLRPDHIHGIHEEMRRGLARFAPQWNQEICYEKTASPRTFERFTGRPGGYVGGIPRRVGLDNYRGIFPEAIAKGLYMVGDSVFPGQSTLATALGGHRVAHTILRAQKRGH
jgi:phytoene dehydrogenase-like protein